MRESPASIEQQHGVRTAFSDADLRTGRPSRDMIATARRDLGDCDMLVNNAVVRHTGPVEAFDPADAWDDAMAVNLSAAFHATGWRWRG